jgi:hypothetical protein
MLGQKKLLNFYITRYSAFLLSLAPGYCCTWTRDVISRQNITV